MGQRKSEGFILSNAGSVMVERRREKLTHGEIRQNIKNIQSVIMQGCPLCIFPEATSAGGGEELVFYSSMFASVEYTDTTIVPFHISYTKANREPLTESTRDTIYFYKGDHLLPHLNKLLNLNNIEAKITFLPDFSAKGKNRKEIRSDCKAIITEEINQ
jgi:1-acyl-sn-glycerol-3-phosphate acyltransferase